MEAHDGKLGDWSGSGLARVVLGELLELGLMRQHGPVALLGEDLVLVVQLGAVPELGLLNIAVVHTEGGHDDLGLRDLARLAHPGEHGLQRDSAKLLHGDIMNHHEVARGAVALELIAVDVDQLVQTGDELEEFRDEFGRHVGVAPYLLGVLPKHGLVIQAVLEFLTCPKVVEKVLHTKVEAALHGKRDQLQKEDLELVAVGRPILVDMLPPLVDLPDLEERLVPHFGFLGLIPIPLLVKVEALAPVQLLLDLLEPLLLSAADLGLACGLLVHR